MAFVYPQPSTEELARFYKSGYFGGNSDFHRGTVRQLWLDFRLRQSG